MGYKITFEIVRYWVITIAQLVIVFFGNVWQEWLYRIRKSFSRVKASEYKSRLPTMSRKERERIKSWMSSRVSEEYVRNSEQFWKNGILLCAVIDSLVKEYRPSLKAINGSAKPNDVAHALDSMEKYIGIKPLVTADDLLDDNDQFDTKLFVVLSQLMEASEKGHDSGATFAFRKRSSTLPEIGHRFTDLSQCIAKGMGLHMSTKGRCTRFNIYFERIDKLNVVLEIRGPKHTYCWQKIVKGMPGHNYGEDNSVVGDNVSIRKIPLQYEVYPNKICVNYTPLEEDAHKLSILWHGQHISGSPFMINVDKSCQNDVIQRTFKTCYDRSIVSTSNNAMSLKKGTVVHRKVLRYIMSVGGTDVVVENPSDLCSVVESIRKKTITNLTPSIRLQNPFEDLKTINSPRDNASKQNIHSIVSSHLSTQNEISCNLQNKISSDVSPISTSSLNKFIDNTCKTIIDESKATVFGNLSIKASSPTDRPSSYDRHKDIEADNRKYEQPELVNETLSEISGAECLYDDTDNSTIAAENNRSFGNVQNDSHTYWCTPVNISVSNSIATKSSAEDDRIEQNFFLSPESPLNVNLLQNNRAERCSRSVLERLPSITESSMEVASTTTNESTNSGASTPSETNLLSFSTFKTALTLKSIDDNLLTTPTVKERIRNFLECSDNGNQSLKKSRSCELFVDSDAPSISVRERRLFWENIAN